MSTISRIAVASAAAALSIATASGLASAHELGQQWELVKEGKPTGAWFSIDGENFHGFDSCNIVNGPVHFDDTTLNFGPHLSTLRACPGNDGLIQDFHASIEGARDVSTEGSTMILTDPASGESWTFVPTMK